MRSQTRSANHHMSCRCSPSLNVNFTVLYVKLIDLSYLNSYGKIFKKRTQFNRVERLCFSDLQFAWIPRLHVASLEAKIE